MVCHQLSLDCHNLTARSLEVGIAKPRRKASEALPKHASSSSLPGHCPLSAVTPPSNNHQAGRGYLPRLTPNHHGTLQNQEDESAASEPPDPQDELRSPQHSALLRPSVYANAMWRRRRQLQAPYHEREAATRVYQ